MYESFSQDVKNEICSVKLKQSCCRASLLRGMVFGTGADTNGIYLESENPSVVMLYARLVKEFAGWKRESDLSLTSIEGSERVIHLLDALGVTDIETMVTSGRCCTECLRSFIKGTFLTCGTVTYPENSYHIEFMLHGKKRADELCGLLTEFGTPPKITERRGELYGVYYKDSDSVLDVLGYLGANKATFKMLDIKIYKDIRNNANRVANCETANIGKTVAAADAQLKAIEKILDSGKADELPDELRETLDLRAAFPSATLSELASMHTPPITKSGVNHRLKRLIDISTNI